MPSTLTNFLKAMTEYIEDRGKSIIDVDENKKNPIKFTKTLLQLKAEMDTMVMNCFGNDPKFNQCWDKSFQAFMNLWNETPYSMSSYCDFMFK